MATKKIGNLTSTAALNYILPPILFPFNLNPIHKLIYLKNEGRSHRKSFQSRFFPAFNSVKLATLSGLSYWVADLLVYPFDTIATRLRANEHVFETFRGEVSKIKRSNAFKELYSGVVTTLPVSFVPTVIYISCYETILKYGKAFFSKHKYSSNYNYLLPIIGNPLAEGIAMMFYLPFDLARTRLQVPETRILYNGLFDCLTQIYEKEGIIRLFNSSHVYIVYSVLFMSIQMCTYEYCRAAFLLSDHDKVDLKTSLSFSALAAMLATLTCNPIDIVLTRFQLVDSSLKRPSAKEIVKNLMKNEGVKGVMKGVGPKMFGNIFYALFFFPVYEHFKTQYGIAIHE